MSNQVEVNLTNGIARRILLDVVIPQLSDGLWENETTNWEKLDDAIIHMVDNNPSSTFKLPKTVDLFELQEFVPDQLLQAAWQFDRTADVNDVEAALNELQEVFS